MGNEKEQNIPPEKKNFELVSGELQRLEKLLIEIDECKNVVIIGTYINESSEEMDILIDGSEKEKKYFIPKLKYKLRQISEKDAVKERGYLKQEYDYEHGVGQHWDNLRWNVSKFFLGIQTAFVVAAMTGFLELSRGKTTHKSLIIIGLILLVFFNIAICIIWWLRNMGIHAWHKVAIRRQRLIELDPRWKQIPWFNSEINCILKKKEGYFKIHGTGDLECWGPPLAFILLWLGILIIVVLYLLPRIIHWWLINCHHCFNN